MYCHKCGKENTEDVIFCIFCGQKIDEPEAPVNNLIPENTKNKFNYIPLIIVVLLILAAIVVFYPANINNDINTNSDNSFSSTSSEKEVDNTKSVVQIICDNASGSGTMIEESGLIITNHHVVEDEDEEACIVTIPDTVTGEPTEIYKTRTIIYPKLSSLYDIAILEINGVYKDKDGKEWGTYPNSFASFEKPKSCSDNPLKLGERIKVYGYPSTSHNYNLTVTEGIISNFDDDGYILTSAKIDSGNSGGLAINEEGCMIGIPTEIWGGDYQNLGAIIPYNYIVEFIEEVIKLEDETTSTITPESTIKPTVTKIKSEPEIISPKIVDNNDTGERFQLVSAVSNNPQKVSLIWNKLPREVLYYTIKYGYDPNGLLFDTSAGQDSKIEIGGLESGKTAYFLIKAGWHGPNSTWNNAYSNILSVKVK